MGINYSQESLRLNAFVPESSSKFWKPKAGQYKVQALTEIEDAEPFREDGKEDKPQCQLKIIVGEETHDWTFSKGKTNASTYGQLVNLAMQHQGQLKGKTFMIVVVSAKGQDGKEKNTYTIVKV